MTRSARVSDTQERPAALAHEDELDVEIINPARDAHRLRLKGASWAEAAASTGFSSAAVAQLAVNAFLQKTAMRRDPLQQEEYLQLELDRLDLLQVAYFPAALDGDIKAAQLVLKIIGKRSALLCLGRQVEETAPVTILVGGNPQDYIAGLKQIAGGTD